MTKGTGTFARCAFRVMLLASFFVALLVGSIHAADYGICSGTITLNPCPGMGYNECVLVTGCNPDNPPGGSCSVRSGGNINGHTYGWYCSDPASGGDNCMEQTAWSNGIMYHPGRNAHDCAEFTCCVGGTCPGGCQWAGPQCGGTASGLCSQANNQRALCLSLGCTWTPTSPPCAGNTCSSNYPPGCCAESPVCITWADSCYDDFDCDPSDRPCNTATHRCVARSQCSQCLTDGTICNSDSECCSNSCDPGTSRCVTPPPPCIPTGSPTACSANADCCSNKCEGSTCVDCWSNGAICSANGDCCSNSCIGGTCATPCIAAGGACTTTGSCCTGLACISGSCTAPPPPTPSGNYLVLALLTAVSLLALAYMATYVFDSVMK